MKQTPMSAQAQHDLAVEEQVYTNWSKESRRWSHVLANPNAKHGQSIFFETIKKAVVGKRVLEIGCQTGYMSSLISSYGARYVLGTDISADMISQARQDCGQPGRVEFAVSDATFPFDGVFDVIVGRAVLHHFQYRNVLLRIKRDNLVPGGQMIFMEPLIANTCMRLFRVLSHSAHTPDERPFSRDDIQWMRTHFPDSTVTPYNYVSIPFGAISSLAFRSPDNVLMRVADHADRFLVRHASFLHHRFRYAVLSLR